MKICPSCAAENRPDAKVCYACGRPLAADSAHSAKPADWSTPPEADLGRTQPRRVRPPGNAPAGDTLPGSVYGPPPVKGPDRPAWDQDGVVTSGPSRPLHPDRTPDPAFETRPHPVTPAANHPPQTPFQAGATAPRPPDAVRRAYGSPPVQPPGPGYPQPIYPAAPQPIKKQPRDTTPAWRVVSFILMLVLACVAVFAVWTAGASIVNSVKRSFAPVPTEVLAQASDDQPGGNEEEQATLAVPTAWPTFTAAPVETAAAEATAAVVETPPPGPDLAKYLTPECASALDHLRSANKQFADNPTAPFRKDWRDDLSLAVSEMKAYCSTLDTASPVPNLIGEAHRNLNLATESFDTAGRLLKEGADELNPGKFVEAGGQLIQAGQYLAQALSDLDQIGE